MAQTFEVNKKRIFKNTAYLYLRMLFTVGVNFYTVRVLLNSLGVEDFGIYNLLFGFVTIFALLNNALTGMVQRYVCYELGRGKLHNAQKNFTISLFLFGCGLIFFLLLAETIGLWGLHCKLEIPQHRFEAAATVYQMAVLCFVWKTLQAPFIAMLTAYEHMSAFAKINIFEMILLLLAVLSLRFMTFDKLQAFSFLYTLTIFCVLLVYALYCFKTLPACRIVAVAGKKRMIAMLSFFSWSVLGAVANIGRNQGLNVLLNLFFSVTMNASWTLSQRIGAAVVQIAGNFQMAFKPQLLKAYTLPDRKAFHDLIISTSRYSFLLIWLLANPLLLQTEFILELWIGKIFPTNLSIFTRIAVISGIFYAIGGSLWTAAQADGKVGQYQLRISCLIGSSFVLSLIFLLFGLPAYWVSFSLIFADIATLMYRLYYLKKRLTFSVQSFIFHALIPMGLISVCSLAITLPLLYATPRGLPGNFLLLVISGIINCVIIIMLGLKRQERRAVFTKLSAKISALRAKTQIE